MTWCEIAEVKLEKWYQILRWFRSLNQLSVWSLRLLDVVVVVVMELSTEMERCGDLPSEIREQPLGRSKRQLFIASTEVSYSNHIISLSSSISLNHSCRAKF